MRSRHILLVADGRSPITRRWIQALLRLGYAVSLVSSFPCEPLPGMDHFAVIPLAFARAASPRSAPKKAGSPQSPPALHGMVGRFRGLFLAARYLLGPLSLVTAVGEYHRLLAEWRPDLVHALRIPYEGMLAAHTPISIPMAVSIWGNDLTLHAHGSAQMRSQTIRCLRRADGLAADAARDLRLGRQWGLRPEAPVLVAPGSGGLDVNELRSRAPSVDFLPALLGEDVPPQSPILINPRGLRPGSVRNDIFFQALPEVLRQVPGLVVLCAAMAGQPEAQRLLEPLRAQGLDRRVFLLPHLPQTDLWDLFHLAQASNSPSAHDGTPNSLLEAMACGCFPVAGDIESLREWITPGVNGLLVPPGDPVQLAEALILAMTCPGLRERAAHFNTELTAVRADMRIVGEGIMDFYSSLMDDNRFSVLGSRPYSP